jgi:hypothetical protein
VFVGGSPPITDYFRNYCLTDELDDKVEFELAKLGFRAL